MIKISWIKRLRIRLFGRVYMGHRTREGWGGYLPFYRVRCKKHGLFEDYPHGSDRSLVCPVCLGLRDLCIRLGYCFFKEGGKCSLDFGPPCPDSR